MRALESVALRLRNLATAQGPVAKNRELGCQFSGVGPGLACDHG